MKLNYNPAIFLLLFLCSCATTSVNNAGRYRATGVDDARARIEYALEYGVIPKHQKEQVLSAWTNSTTPKVSPSPINKSRHKLWAQSSARKIQPFSDYNKSLNAGLITGKNWADKVDKEKERRAEFKRNMAIIATGVAVAGAAVYAVKESSSGSSGRSSTYAPSSSGYSGNYYNSGSGHWIQKNIEGGKYILLEDNSLWQVHNMDTIKSSLWLSVSRITIAEGNEWVGYNLLINTDEGEAVSAKYIGQQ